MTASDRPPGNGHTGGELHRFTVQRIPPSHDYIRSHGSGPKDGWAKGPADPGSPPVSPDPVEPEAASVDENLADSGDTQTPVYGSIHKFGYTRPLKRHEQASSAGPGEAAVADGDGDGEVADASPFVHLHVHSNFSFLDGGSRIEDLVARAAELEQPALALTDHDGLYGAVRFAKACAKRGIKPIFGAEVRVESLLPEAAKTGEAGGVTIAVPSGGSRGGPAEPTTPEDPHHLVLLAEDREGYANLCRLLSAAHLAIPERDRPPLVTIASLRQHNQGLICLTGCRHGEVGYLVDAGRDDDARSALLALRDIFGPDHLFVELQYFGYEPHREARAGQDGAAVYAKIHGDYKRIHHRLVPADPGLASRPDFVPVAPVGTTSIGTVTNPAVVSAHTTVATDSTDMRNRCNATNVASWRVPDGRFRPIEPSSKLSTKPRPDLPQGQPQRLNPSDYDVGFHRNGHAWRLSCLTYCLHLGHLAAECHLPTILTNDAHYAAPDDRGIHLICRAAGHDKPLSGYPDPAPGSRCLKSRLSLEVDVFPLLQLQMPRGCDRRDPDVHIRCNATVIAITAGVPGEEHGGLRYRSDAGAPNQSRTDSCRDCQDLSNLNSPCDLNCNCLRDCDENSTRDSLCDPRRGWDDGSHRGCHGPSHPSCYGDSQPSCYGDSQPDRHDVSQDDYTAMSPLDATWAVTQRCNVDLELGQYHFPKVDVPRGETAYSLLAKRCFRGIARMYKPVPPRAVELLEKELRMIQQMDFAHYFLVVHDIVRWARAQGVACSGRGSAGNSIVCHALDITASEPIRHNLLFERFLNPNRREMPDIDVDFCSSRRDEVIEHIYQTFGSENVAVVANVNTMSPRSAVRIVAEALGFAPTEINALAKHVPRHGDAARIREYLAGAWPELRDSPLQDGGHAVPATPPSPDGKGGFTPGTPARPEGRYARFLDLVERLDSFPMHLGTHLGGFVIADRPITYYAPLQWAAKGVVVIQFNKDDVAALGLVKMDILGLRTHSAVSECVHLVRQRTGRRIRPYDLPPDDPASYEIVSNGGSIGLFQLESAGQRNLASRLQERDFDDVIAAIALYRPGPLEAEMIGPFIDRRWGLEPVVLPHPAMAEAVADTYGVILYQEQVLRIAQSVAGFDLADADSLRRAMTRDRSREEMAKIGETFISRAVERGVPEEAAHEVFRQLEGFAAYGFNKSHSVCFAVIAYATAYLKAYYPAEFLAAILNNQPMGFYTPRTVLNDARRFGLTVRPLDINLSGRGFTVEDEMPPDPWSDAPYDPFALAWTAEHDWGLTDADLAELRAEQEGELAYAEALRAALETQGANPGAVLAGSAESPPASPAPALSPTGGGEAPETGRADPPTGEARRDGESGREASPPPGEPPRPLRPGDLMLPRAPRARGGVLPGTSLAPSCGIAPDAGKALRVGFSYLKQMGGRSLDRIEEERRHGPFTSFEDFYLRTRIDYPVAENLIRVGAFDSLEPDRTELLWRLPLLHDRLEALAGSSGQRRGQLRAFFSPPSRAGLERQWSLEDKVRSELELLGLTVSCHPLQLYEEELRRMGVRMSYELPGLGDEVSVTVAGVYERAQNPWMRSGKRTMFLTLEDAYGLFECVCFESKLDRIAPVVARASYFLVRGRLQNNHKRGLAIVAEEVFDLEEVLARRKAGKRGTRPATGAAGQAGRGTGTRAIPKKVG